MEAKVEVMHASYSVRKVKTSKASSLKISSNHHTKCEEWLSGQFEVK